MFRSGLRSLISHDPELCVVGEAADGSETIEQLRKLNPDLLLLDLAMPCVSGIEVLRTMQDMRTGVRTIVLAAEVQKSEIVEALRFGARGVMLKQVTTELLFKAIRAVMAGEFWVGQDGLAGLVDTLQADRHSRSGNGNGGGNKFDLSPRELEIVAAIVDGCTNEDVARRFNLKVQTVKHNLTAIFAKTGVSNRMELALFALQHRLS
jgi:DNA-binding NarL/FixJ family response regulator